MEPNLCDGNHSDSNVLLPPRKRLLAGFIKRNSDHNFRIEALMENPNLSLEEIVEKSSSAAEEAVNVAVAARARAEEKEVVAAKAMARAKGALELVADMSDEVNGHNKRLKKNKMKKQLPVKTFYKNVEKCNKDEEFALRLHHAMNSSQRITKNSANSNSNANKSKRVKGLSIVEGPRVSSDGHFESESEETDSEDLTSEGGVIGCSRNASKRKHNSLNIGDRKGESSYSKGKSSESSDDFSRRMKQNKLPLSIRGIKDLENTSEEMRMKGALLSDESIGKNNSVMWKCKAFKAPDCVKQNKVIEQ